MGAGFVVVMIGIGALSYTTAALAAQSAPEISPCDANDVYCDGRNIQGSGAGEPRDESPVSDLGDSNPRAVLLRSSSRS